MSSLTTFQRLALVTIVVCLVTFVATRMVHADHPHYADALKVEAEVEAAVLAHEEAVEAALEVAAEADVEARARAEEQSALTFATVISAQRGGDILYERSFPVRSGDRLAVQLSSEDVVVETTRGREASVTVEGRGPDAQDEFERRRFDAEYDSGTLRVRTNPERRSHRSNVQAGFTVTVRVPASMDVAIAVSSGDVRMGDVEGAVAIDASSGDIQLGLVERGPVSLNTSSGDITARGLSGAVTINTSSGDIQLGEVYSETASINTSSGDVTIQTLEADHFSVNSSSGDLDVDHLDAVTEVSTSSGEVEFTLARFHGLTAHTGSGSVELGLPGGSGASVTINSGDIEIDDRLEFQGSRQRRIAQGRLGAGGPSLSITTGSGSVELHRH